MDKVSSELVGRQVELDRLDTLLDAVARGSSEVVLVGGEAGVGKSRLVNELGGHAKARGFRVAVGRCMELGEEIWPLAPLREILATVTSELDSEAFDLVMGGARGVLSRLVPEAAADYVGEGPVDGGRLCELAVGVFRRLARRGPLVLVVEDLHWADSTTRTLFALVARARELGPVLVVGTYRSDELHRRHPLRPLLAEIIRSARPEHIELRPLDRAGTAKVVAAIGKTEASVMLVDEFYRLSTGNPFFVEELVAARAAGIEGFPATLRDVVLARAATLDETACEVLRIAAAAGPTLPRVVADVCKLDPPSLAATIDTLVAAALLVSDGDEVRFRHELAREVFYGELAPGQRADVHARLARSCEALRPERPGDIARHWSAAHDAPRALSASLAAGRHALRTGAAAEAESHFGRVLELWSVVDDAETLAGLDHPALLAEASEAAKHAQHLVEAIDLGLRAATELAGIDPLREGRVWLQLRELFRFADRWEECENAVQRALLLIPPSPPSSERAEALTHAALGYYYVGHAAECLSNAREAVAMAEVVADPDVLVYARIALGAALGLMGDPEQELAYVEETLALCGADVSPERVLTALNGVTNALGDLCRPSEIVALAERGVGIARQTGLGGPRGAWLAVSWLAALVDLGRWEDAEGVVAEVWDLVEEPSTQAELVWSWGVALMRQGRLDEARPLVERARSLLQSGRQAIRGQNLADIASAVVEFDVSEQRYEAAATLAADVLERCFSPLNCALLVAHAVSGLADYCEAARVRNDFAVVARAEATASTLLDRLECISDWMEKPRQYDVLDLERARAELARLRREPQAQSWIDIADRWQSLGLPSEEAYARFRGAEAHLAGTAGRADLARKLATTQLVRARALAVSLRAAPLLGDIDALARRARLSIVAAASVPQIDAAPLDHFGLTPREQDVLALLTEGRSNGDIAKVMFITTKTASFHVSNILRKLGVTNRVEAAALVHHGMVGR